MAMIPFLLHVSIPKNRAEKFIASADIDFSARYEKEIRRAQQKMKQ